MNDLFCFRIPINICISALLLCAVIVSWTITQNEISGGIMPVFHPHFVQYEVFWWNLCLAKLFHASKTGQRTTSLGAGNMEILWMLAVNHYIYKD